MKIAYFRFKIIIHIIVALVFLTDLLKSQLPIKMYTYLKENKDIIFGIYYLYLAYDIYINMRSFSKAMMSE